MRDFIAQYCHKNDNKINRDLFERKFDRPLVDFIIDTVKNLEVLPGVTLESYEYVTDQTKIHTSINKRNKRDPKIKNNKCLERLASPNSSVYDMLYLHFKVEVKGQTEYVTRQMKVPKIVKGCYYIRGGKLVLPLIQIVDNSTFAKQSSGAKKDKDNILNFKTTLYPIKLWTTPKKIKFVDGDSFPVPLFQIDLFMKVTNPLYYFLAQYGLEATIEMFDLDRIISVVDDILDEDNYLYLKVNDKLYLEVHEKGFYAHPFVGKFVGTLLDCLMMDKQKITLQDAYDRDYWLGRLAEIFSKKRNVDKGKRVLISFKKIMDPHSKKRLMLKKYQKRDTFQIMKWMLTNYEELLMKDSNDLRTKRMRANEIQAYFFDSYITKNVNSLLNTDNPSMERYLRLLNAINDDTLFKAPYAGGGSNKSTPTSMFRYEKYNDFDAINLSRYTLKGPTGLNGGKKKTSTKYRDIYPSHLGRFDVNVCSSSDQGLTGFLCANVQFDKNGYFDADKAEPNVYDPVIEEAIDGKCEPGYVQSRQEYIHTQLSRDKDGFIVLQKKLTADELNAEFANFPWQYGLYPTDSGLQLMEKQGPYDNKGFIKLIQKTPVAIRKAAADEVERDDDGFIILKKTISKLNRKK